MPWWGKAGGYGFKKVLLLVALLCCPTAMATGRVHAPSNAPFQATARAESFYTRTGLQTRLRPFELTRCQSVQHADTAPLSKNDNAPLMSPNLTAAFPDLALWLAGPADLRQGICRAIHPGLKRAPLPIPNEFGTGKTGHGNVNASSSPTLAPASSVPAHNTIPVVVLSHNNPTYLHAMVRFLRCYGVVNITVYDTASSLPLHLELLGALGRVATVQQMRTNDGPRSFFSASNLARLPRFFALTDADLRPHPDLAPNFLAYLAALTQVFPGRKAGFALDLTMRDQFLQGSYASGLPISGWEEKFWRTRLPTPHGGPPDTLYDADIDTTFAVYDKHAYPPGAAGKIAWRYQGVRVGGTFAATHVPWLCYATAKYMSPTEWNFAQARQNGWSTTTKLALKNTDKLGDVCAGASR